MDGVEGRVVERRHEHMGRHIGPTQHHAPETARPTSRSRRAELTSGKCEIASRCWCPPVTGKSFHRPRRLQLAAEGWMAATTGDIRRRARPTRGRPIDRFFGRICTSRNRSEISVIADRPESAASARAKRSPNAHPRSGQEWPSAAHSVNGAFSVERGRFLIDAHPGRARRRSIATPRGTLAHLTAAPLCASERLPPPRPYSRASERTLNGICSPRQPRSAVVRYDDEERSATSTSSNLKIESPNAAKTGSRTLKVRRMMVGLPRRPERSPGDQDYWNGNFSPLHRIGPIHNDFVSHQISVPPARDWFPRWRGGGVWAVKFLVASFTADPVSNRG